MTTKIQAERHQALIDLMECKVPKSLRDEVVAPLAQQDLVKVLDRHPGGTVSKIQLTQGGLVLAMQLAKKAGHALDRRGVATTKEITRARKLYVDGSNDDIEVDNDARVSIADTGIWVQAWIWLPDEEEDNAG